MKKKNKILGDQWGSYNTNAGVWEKVPLLDSCYFYSQVWRLLSAFLHTSIPFCNIVYTLNILHTDILTMQNQASSASQAAIVTTWIFVKVSQHFNTLQRSAHSKFLFPGPWGKLKRKFCHYGLTERGLSTLISGSIFFIHFSVHFLW